MHIIAISLQLLTLNTFWDTCQKKKYWLRNATRNILPLYSNATVTLGLSPIEDLTNQMLLWKETSYKQTGQDKYLQNLRIEATA